MREWIFPSNPGKYRVDDALNDLKVIEWIQNKNSTNVKPGDIVYIYSSNPVSSIQWKCEVLDSHKNPATINDGKYFIPPKEVTVPYDQDVMVLRAISKLDAGGLLDYSVMKQHGLKSRIQGPIPINIPELLDYIHKVVDGNNNLEEIVIQEAASMDIGTLKQLAKKYSQDRPKEITSKSKQYYRNPIIAEYAKKRANGICQLCKDKAPFIDKYNRPYLESHHIKWLSDGGADSIENTVALCPNFHRKMHVLRREEDIKKLKASN